MVAEDVERLLPLRRWVKGWMRTEFVHNASDGGGLIVVVITEEVCGAPEEMLIHDVVRSVSEINDVLIVVDVPVLVMVVAGLEVDA